MFQCQVALLPSQSNPWFKGQQPKNLSLASHLSVKCFTNPDFCRVRRDFFCRLLASGSSSATKGMDLFLSRLSTLSLCQPVVSTTQDRTFMKAVCFAWNAAEQWIPRWNSRSRLKAAFWYCSLNLVSLPPLLSIAHSHHKQRQASRSSLKRLLKKQWKHQPSVDPASLKHQHRSRRNAAATRQSAQSRRNNMAVGTKPLQHDSRHQMPPCPYAKLPSPDPNWQQWKRRWKLENWWPHHRGQHFSPQSRRSHLKLRTTI